MCPFYVLVFVVVAFQFSVVIGVFWGGCMPIFWLEKLRQRQATVRILGWQAPEPLLEACMRVSVFKCL